MRTVPNWFSFRGKRAELRRLSAILGSFLFLLIAPGFVAGVIPYWISRWHAGAAFAGSSAVRILGLLLIISGVPLLLDSFTRFALEGLGTPAPVFPTRHLVVTGFYRHLRNPMYAGVASVIFGQALYFRNVRVLGYGAIIFLAFHLFILFYEEPTLRGTFGREYAEFCENLPRWIPRLTRWRARV
jgi:protein-S-isoprenylcysteine O-methyltransferase Ste14